MRMAFVALILLIIFLCVYFFLPQTDTDIREEAVSAEQIQADKTESQQSDKLPDEEESDPDRLAKEETFEQLAKARRNLDRRLARLKALLWNKQLPREQAEQINQELLTAYGLLRNKKLLGAFGSLAAIEDELTKVNHAYETVVEISQKIKTMPNAE